MPVTAVPSSARAIPKSASRGPSAPSSTFAGLRSRCTIPARVHVGERVGQPGADPQHLVRVERARLEALGQRGPLDEVGDDERAAVLDPAVVQGDEPGMVQRGERAHLALLAAAVVRRGAGVEELDGERAAGDAVRRAADHRRRPRPEQRAELVAAADDRRVGPGGRDGPLVHGRGVPGDPVDHTKPPRSCTNPEDDDTPTGNR